MGKHAAKALDGLQARIDAWPGESVAGLHFKKPGSQNRKKAYRRKAGRKGR